MTPYYEDDLVTLYHGDCREVTEWLEADVLVTDPPYGLDSQLSAGRKGRSRPSGHARTSAKPDWDRNLEVRDAALAMWGERPYAVFGSPARLDGALPYRGFPLVWDKGTVGMGDTTFPWGRSYELVYVNGPGWSGTRESSVLHVLHPSNIATQIGHPTPKPVGLMASIIRKAPAGVIADPFSGSGSTLVAAKTEGRRAIGVEFWERYAEIAANRLSQDTLFGGVG